MAWCEKCGKQNDGTFGSGRFCSRTCANSRKFTKEANDSRSRKLEGRRLSNETRFKIANSLKDPIIKKRQIESIRRYWDTYFSQTEFEALSEKSKRKITFRRLGNVCSKCGFSYTDPESGKGPFEIHHIDGNHRNWNTSNLQVLCLICHWKTGNWRFRGRSHTDESRMKISRNTNREKLWCL